jgi:hypothetical protein
MNHPILKVLLPVFLVEILTNSAWIAVSFDQRVRENFWLSYSIATIGGTLSGMAWCYLARNTPQEDMFFVNMAWDVIVTAIFISLPVFYYGLKLDIHTIGGAVLAAIGLLLMNHE